MKINRHIISCLKKQAEKSPSAYRIGGIAVSKRGNILGTAFNTFRVEQLTPGPGTNNHCEAVLIKKYGRRISTIIIMRIGRGGAILKIDPCQACQKLADKLGIKIITVNAD